MDDIRDFLLGGGLLAMLGGSVTAIKGWFNLHARMQKIESTNDEQARDLKRMDRTLTDFRKETGSRHDKLDESINRQSDKIDRLIERGIVNGG